MGYKEKLPASAQDIFEEVLRKYPDEGDDERAAQELILRLMAHPDTAEVEKVSKTLVRCGVLETVLSARADIAASN